ncbi:MAG: hypothetical protein K2X03_26970 [Bryobacteraceae bacterium]|nr:hypothetical protein [Bryobacteraceae bacterium]
MLEVHSAAESEEKIQFDDDLVVLAKSGDHTAFVELIRRHRLMSFKLAYSILRDRARTEDELQNATLKAFAHLEQFQGDAKFSTWLASIVVNQCLMCLRRDKRAKILYLDDFQLGEEMGRSTYATTPIPPKRICAAGS